MLDRFRGSSILFSKNFQTEHEFYLKSDFINKAYYYYINKGFYNIISSSIVNLLISTFTVGFILFLYKCVDYNGLIDVDTNKEPLSNYIHWDNYFELNYIIWFLLIVYILFILVKIINIIEHIIIYGRIRRFYNKTLNLKDSHIVAMSWEDIIIKLERHYKHSNINVYYIANRITVKDNYMIALINKNVLELNELTSLMEWNIMYSIIHKIFNDEAKIKNDIFSEQETYIEGIKSRIKFIVIINFIFMPFILVFTFFYNFFYHGEKFYNKPALLTTYTWTNMGRWKIRDYNELYHNFHERLNNAEKPAKEYCNQFPTKIIGTFAKFIVFLANSFFLVLVILSLINEQIIINLYISHDRSALWYMGILATVSTIGKVFISTKLNYYPKEKMKDIKEFIDYVPIEWIENANRSFIKTNFSKLFEYKIMNILKNIFYTLCVPFQLWKLYYKVDNIVHFIISSSYKHTELGYICKYSLFDKMEYITDTKTHQSYNNFKKIYKMYNNDFVNSAEESAIII